MPSLSVLYYPDKRLRQASKAITEITPEILELVDGLKKTLEEEHGLGIAAPQVGVLKRVIIIRSPEEGIPIAVINPEINESSGKVTFKEACLSLPGIEGEVTRASKVTLTGLNERGEKLELTLEHIFAACAQHEIDHLFGILFIDKLSNLRKQLIKGRLRNLSLLQDVQLHFPLGS